MPTLTQAPSRQAATATVSQVPPRCPHWALLSEAHQNRANAKKEMQPPRGRACSQVPLQSARPAEVSHASWHTGSEGLRPGAGSCRLPRAVVQTRVRSGSPRMLRSLRLGCSALSSGPGNRRGCGAAAPTGQGRRRDGVCRRSRCAGKG